MKQLCASAAYGPDADCGINGGGEQSQQVMFLDTASSARPVPNLRELEALDAYYAWRRQQARQQSNGR